VSGPIRYPLRVQSARSARSARSAGRWVWAVGVGGGCGRWVWAVGVGGGCGVREESMRPMSLIVVE
jgi:hypothetical protein